MTQNADTTTSTPAGQGGHASTTTTPGGATNQPDATTKPGDGGTTTGATETKPSSILGAGDGGGSGGATGEDRGQPSGKPAAGAEIEVTLPDGVQVDSDTLTWFKATAKTAGLDSETASKVATAYAQRIADTNKAQDDALRQQDKEWVETLKTDADFGGSHYSETVAAAQRAIVRFGGDELRTNLDQMGIGNHPALVRTFARIGKAIGEDNSGGGGAPGEKKPTKEEFLANLYNNSQ